MRHGPGLQHQAYERVLSALPRLQPLPMIVIEPWVEQ
jgi:hypothetical protein